MALVEEVARICERLAPGGWHQLMLQHGLDLLAPDVAKELDRPLDVRRTCPGFEDFALEGMRGIEPGNPARSLLFHALAAPHVNVGASGAPLTLFPTAAEIETVLNYVYSTRRLPLEELLELADGAPVAIVTFAAEYRAKAQTVHQKHADFSFSRTGIARVGNAPAHYDARARGFWPRVEEAPTSVAVTPARYSTYLAVRQPGDNRIGPRPFVPQDDQRNFWVPLHKLFAGQECILGLDLNLSLQHYHVNDKLRQFHLRQFDVDPIDPVYLAPPYRMTDNLARWAPESAYGPGLLMPQAQPMVEMARSPQGELVGFMVPPKAELGGYILHRRFQLGPDGSIHDLSTEPNVDAVVDAGGYRALHILDFTAEGWVQARCPALESRIEQNLAAYSLIAAPDFYPGYTPGQLLAWFEQQTLPAPFFGQTLRVLANTRSAGNVALPGPKFALEDKTITAIISLPSDPLQPPAAEGPAGPLRQTWLPDAAAGTFSPGWDVTGEGGSFSHPAVLRADTLGSPFPEDVRLCASIGGYWPALSPDASRTFAPTERTRDWIPVIPLTDQEAGVGGAPAWDGVEPPRLLVGDEGPVVRYTAFEYADYTKNALNGHLSLHATARTGADDYQRRIISMHQIFLALGATTRPEKSAWSVLSFSHAISPDPELTQAEQATGRRLEAPIYACQVFRNDRTRTVPVADDFTRQDAVVLELVQCYVSARALLFRRASGQWEARELGEV